jgi:isopentenyl-diphosphate delta-isomerase
LCIVANQFDPSAETRKQDHIELAFRSQVAMGELDGRFYFEPLLSAHPMVGSLEAISFLGKRLRVPIWVSSMTGGTQHAGRINEHLARACGEFGMGMGLGSCRQLLYSDDYLSDFRVRRWMGDEVPFYANLGVAQLEGLIAEGALERVGVLVDKLEADGLMVHVNPLQEWMQPEGDRFKVAPLDTIRRVLEYADGRFGVVVKEVGQGFGKESLRTLLQLPLAGIEFGAAGGTNFTKLELLRSDEAKQAVYRDLWAVGHSAVEMVGMVNDLVEELGDSGLACRQIIASGGVKNFLDGYYLVKKLRVPAVYGQASSFLEHAKTSYDALQQYVSAQIEGYRLANAYLRLKD